MVEIFTDGASRGNPGPGGYGVILRYKNNYKELSKGYRLTTNNRMELMACIAGLEALKTSGLDVTIYSDSKYVVDTIENGWIFTWMRKADFGKKKNKDLWLHFMHLFKLQQIRMVWVKGHNEHLENERCDELATRAADGIDLDIDEGYESLGSGSIFLG